MRACESTVLSKARVMIIMEIDIECSINSKEAIGLRPGRGKWFNCFDPGWIHALVYLAYKIKSFYLWGATWSPVGWAEAAFLFRLKSISLRLSFQLMDQFFFFKFPLLSLFPCPCDACARTTCKYIFKEGHDLYSMASIKKIKMPASLISVHISECVTLSLCYGVLE